LGCGDVLPPGGGWAGELVVSVVVFVGVVPVPVPVPPGGGELPLP
jgi:hypothetical protein